MHDNPLTHSLLLFYPKEMASATICHKQTLKYLISPDVAKAVSRGKKPHTWLKKKSYCLDHDFPNLVVLYCWKLKLPQHFTKRNQEYSKR